MRDLLPYLEHATSADGLTPTAISFLSINRRSHASPVPHAHVLRPSVGIFVAGHKHARVGARDIDLRPGDLFAVARPTPTLSQIVRAPYVALLLSVDVDLVASLLAFSPARSSDITEPLARLARLLHAPAEIPALAPLIQRELFYRLLAGPHGATLVELARGHDPAVAAATAWLDDHFAEPFSAARLAAHAHASVSALYARFKARMRMTPLQYQKERRLEAARRLLLSDDIDVSMAAHRVGYASVAQFTRDYRRRFSVPPRRDAAALRGR